MLDELLGQTIAERYHLRTVLGRGGMGAVFRAEDLQTKRSVAVKVLLPSNDAGERLRRFRREARLAASIHHPHVVRVYDSGRWGRDPTRYFLVMELVDGCSLDALLFAELPITALCDLMVQAVGALGHIHAREALHRDIKPENLLVTRRRDGRLVLKIADFGVAAALRHEPNATRLTADGMVVGTAAYMAPEQVESAVMLGPAIDLYSVGVILFECITGHLPFEGPPMRVMLAKLDADPPPLEPRAGEVIDPALAEVVRTLLARRPEQRYARAADVLDALRPLSAPALMSVEDWNAVVRQGEEHHSSSAGGLDPEATAPGAAEVMWGRAAEQERLHRLAAEVEERETGHIMVVFGTSGLGKSMLASHVAAAVHEQGRFEVLRGNHGAIGGISAALRGAAERWLGTSGRARSEVEGIVRQVVRRSGSTGGELLEDLLAFLRPEAMQGDEDGFRQRRYFATFCRLLRCLARRRAVLLVLDDVDAADPGAAAFFEQFVLDVQLDPYPVLVLACARSGRGGREPSQRFARARSRGDVLQTMTLEPLPTQLLSDRLVETQGLSPSDAEELARRAGGNPLFAKLLARALAESDTRIAARAGGAVSLPESLSALLRTHLDDRLEQVSDRDRCHAVLVHLAVLGEQADVDLLARFVASSDVLDDDLDELIDLEILVDAYAGRERVGFGQGLLREAVLHHVPARKLRRLHQRAAPLRIAYDAEDDPGAIGDHLAAAGKTDEAIDWWVQGFTRALRTGDPHGGRRWGECALDALADDDPRTGPCAVRVARILRAEGDLEAASRLLERATGDPDSVLCAAEVQAEIKHEQNDGAGWEQTISGIAAHLEAASPLGRRAALRARAFFYNHQMRFEEGREAGRQALVGTPSADEAVVALQRIAWASLFLEDHADAVASARRAVDEAGERLDLKAEALRTLARVLSFDARCDVDEALELSGRSRGLQRRCGRMAKVVTVTLDAVWMLCTAGRFEEGRVEAERALAVARRMGLGVAQIRARILVAWSRMRTEPNPGDVEALRTLHRDASASGYRPVLAFIDALWLQALVQHGRSAEALEHWNRLDRLESLPRQTFCTHALAELGEAFADVADGSDATGDLRDAAVAILDRARRRSLVCGDVSCAEGCRVRLEGLQSR